MHGGFFSHKLTTTVNLDVTYAYSVHGGAGGSYGVHTAALCVFLANCVTHVQADAQHSHAEMQASNVLSCLCP